MRLIKIYLRMLMLISAIICVCFGAGCRSKFSKFDFTNHRLDQQVINKFPLYDSLGWLLLKYYPSIEQHFKNGMRFQYITRIDGNDLYKAYPKEAADKIKTLLNTVGDDYLYGFEVFKDSTMKFLVRDTYVQEYNLNIAERLSFFPRGDNIKHKEPPNKDTILNKHWQYWIAFDERTSLF